MSFKFRLNWIQELFFPPADLFESIVLWHLFFDSWPLLLQNKCLWKFDARGTFEDGL